MDRNQVVIAAECAESPSQNVNRWTALLIAALLFCTVAPTLTWTEFNVGVETLTVDTALEMRRDGHWLLPTLEGEPRVRKPPLAAWIAAAAIRPGTLANLSNPDAGVRLRAYGDLTFEVRWPSLLCACLALLAIYDIGQTLIDPIAGLCAAAIAGTNVLFAFHISHALTDVQLFLWTTVAMAGMVRMVFGDARCPAPR